MDGFSFRMPTRIEFGEGKESHVGELVSASDGARVLIVYGGGSVKRSGLLQRVIASLDRSLIPHTILCGVRPNPLSNLVREGVDLARDEKVDFVLALGGGSVIDTAKAIAAGVPYNGDFWDFYEGERAPETALPVGVVLTTAATGSEADGDSVITSSETGLKRETSAACLRPRFTVMDPALTETLPAYQTACGIFDIMSHLYEAYLSTTAETSVSDRMIEGVMIALTEQAPRVMADPHDHQARANIMWAANVALNGMIGAGREQDWGSHEIEYALSSEYGVAHGAGLAVTMPAVLSWYAARSPERLATLAVRVWGAPEPKAGDPAALRAAAEEGIAALRAFADSLGLPATLEEVGGADAAADIPRMAHDTCFSGGRTGTVGGFIPMDEAAVTEVFRLMCA